MQHTMKELQLSGEEIEQVLAQADVGRISTLNEKGYPYTVAVHYVWMDGKIYFHGLQKGHKLDNIKRNPKVCFEVDRLHQILREEIEMPCKVDTLYESVVILGDALILDEEGEKRQVLNQFVNKYTPDMEGYNLPEARVNGTAVVEINVREMTGKAHK